MEVIKCPSCNTELMYKQEKKELKCVFCGASILANQELDCSIDSKKILEFEIGLDEAKEKAKLYFADSAFDLKDYIIKILEPIYIPYWIYDCVCEVESEFYTGVKNRRHYMDTAKVECRGILVKASTKVEEQLAEEVDIFFELGKIKDVDSMYNTEYYVEKSDVTNEMAVENFNKKIKRDVIHNELGFDHSMFFKPKIELSQVKTTYVQLPFYYAEVRGVKLLINGQTGDVSINSKEYLKNEKQVALNNFIQSENVQRNSNKIAFVGAIAILIGIIVFSNLVENVLDDNPIFELVKIIFLCILIFLFLKKKKTRKYNYIKNVVYKKRKRLYIWDEVIRAKNKNIKTEDKYENVKAWIGILVGSLYLIFLFLVSKQFIMLISEAFDDSKYILVVLLVLAATGLKILFMVIRCVLQLMGKL